MKEIELSGFGYKIGLLISTILIIVFIPVVISIIVSSKEIHIGLFLCPVLLLGLIGIVVYLILSSGDVKIFGDKIFIKKMFRPEINIETSQIVYVSSINYRRTKYTTLEYKKNSKYEIDKVIIIRSRNIFETEYIDPEEILKSLRREAKKKLEESKNKK